MNYFEEQTELILRAIETYYYVDARDQFSEGFLKQSIRSALENAALAGRIDSHIAELTMNGGESGS